jgi:hypothetical protein
MHEDGVVGGDSRVGEEWKSARMGCDGTVIYFDHALHDLTSQDASGVIIRL